MRIILTGYTEVEDLMNAINEGHVHRYITKPWDPFILQQSVKQEIRHRELKQENSRLAGQLKKANQQLQTENRKLRQEVERLQHSDSEFIFESSEMKQLLELVDRVVETDSTVADPGRDGHGERADGSLHPPEEWSSRRALRGRELRSRSRDLVESAFFGHRKGAFTGATRDSKASSVRPTKGTIFLDEIGDAPLHLQVKLLRVLQEAKSCPWERHVPGRWTCESLPPPTAASTSWSMKGGSRQDLFFRLNVFFRHGSPSEGQAR